jgi:26S proteasome non-ATPase regulatory subunit 9
MQVTREYLLDLDKKRLKLEEEIMSLTNFLNSEGMPGVEGRLIDNEGFPLANVDIMAVRTARNKLILLQNDLKNLMLAIEKNMQEYFKADKDKRIQEVAKVTVAKEEPISISVYEENLKSSGSSLKIPFAWVGSIMESSPADEAGLKPNDGIITFDKTLFYGVSSNPLQKLAEIVGRKVGQEIEVEVLRKDEELRPEYLNIVLVPHQWSGQGVLG